MQKRRSSDKPAKRGKPGDRRTLIAAVLSLSVIALLCSCNLTKKNPGPVSFGIAAAWNGANGARLAVEQINAAGGINGRELKLDIADNGDAASAEPSIAIAMQYLDAPQILAVIGHPNSPATLASSQLYNERHLVQLVPNATSPLLTDAGPWTFRICMSDVLQGKQLAEYAVRQMGAHKIAILFVNDDYGKGLKDVFYDRAVELGASISMVAPYDSGPEFDPILDYMKQTNPDFLFLALRTGPLMTVGHWLQQRNFHPKLLAGDSVNRWQLQSNDQGMRDLEGMRHTLFFSPLRNDAKVQEFVRAYQQKFNQLPDDEAALNYDAVFLLKRATEMGGATREGIRDYLDTVGTTSPPFEGVAGRVIFDRNGDSDKPLQLAVIKNGKLIPLENSVDVTRQ
jgi:branched-chain amino acid transport system substrate-binding protein